MTTYKYTELRKFIDENLRTHAEFDAFCCENFPRVFEQFSAGMPRAVKVNLLLQAIPHEKIEEALSRRLHKNQHWSSTVGVVAGTRRILKYLHARLKNWDWRVYDFTGKKYPAREGHASESSSAATNRLIYTIILESKNHWSADIIPNILRELRRISGDSSLRIISIKQGSIVIELDGTEAGYEKIIAAIQQEALRAVLNQEIKSIKIVRTVPSFASTPASESSVCPKADSEYENMESYTNEQTRLFIKNILVTDSMLTAFIIDYFPRVKQAITDTMDRIQKTSLLIEMENNPDVMRALKRNYPEEFKKCRQKIAEQVAQFSGCLR